MLTIWKQNEQLIEISSLKKHCWVNISNPTPEELYRVTNEFYVPEDFVNDILDVDERSRTETDRMWFMIILRVPVYRIDEGIPYITVPLGILISQHAIITMSLYEIDIIRDILHPIKHKKINFENKINFVLELFMRSSTLYLKFLKDINIRTSQIERDLERSMKNMELQNMLRMEKCLVFFITSLKSNELLLQKLQRSRYANSADLDEELLSDVIIETKQAIEMSQIYSDIQAGLMDVFASVISNNLNAVMKQLTSITIILMIPTLVSSMYGMNLRNHMEDNPMGFVFVILISAVLATIGVYFFRRRNWF